MRADDLEGFDALILLTPRFDARSIAPDGRLAPRRALRRRLRQRRRRRLHRGRRRARHHAGRRAPAGGRDRADLRPGARRPAADQGPADPAGRGRLGARSDHMGMGVTGRTLGLLGIGNIGAEVFRLAAPFGMRLIAHDPYADARAGARRSASSWSTSRRCSANPTSSSISVPLERGDARPGRRDGCIGLMKPTAYLINTARGPIVDQTALVDGARRRPHRRRRASTSSKRSRCRPTIRSWRSTTSSSTPHALCWTDECFAGNGAADVRAVLALKRRRELHPASSTGHVLAQPTWRDCSSAAARRASGND